MKTKTRADPNKLHGPQKVGDVIREIYPHLKKTNNKENEQRNICVL